MKKLFLLKINSVMFRRQVLVSLLCFVSAEMFGSSAASAAVASSQGSRLSLGEEIDHELAMAKAEFEALVSDYGEENKGDVFLVAAENNQARVVDMMMKDKEFNQMGEYESLVKKVLDIAIERHHEKMVEILLSNIENRFPELLGYALIVSVRFGNKRNVAMILNNHQFNQLHYRELSLNMALSEAQQKALEATQAGVQANVFTAIIHLLKAYSALKPDSELFEQETEILKAKYPAVATQFIAAYKTFLNGNPTDLQRLLFPRPHGAYLLTPVHDVAAIPLKIIEQTLADIFKEDHIKSLLFTLVETVSQKKAAQGMLDRLGLSEKVKAQRQADLANAAQE